MRHIGRLQGAGQVVIGGKNLGAAKYDIDVYRDGAFKTASGMISADERVIWEAFTADEHATLVLPTARPSPSF
jgi:hypothetical protein